MDSKNIQCIEHYFLLWEILCLCLSLTVLEEARTELLEEQRSSTYNKVIFYLLNPSKDKMAEFHYLALLYNDPTSRDNQDAVCKISGQHDQEITLVYTNRHAKKVQCLKNQLYKSIFQVYVCIEWVVIIDNSSTFNE